MNGARFLRPLAYAAVLAVTIVGTYLATRPDAASAPGTKADATAPGHDHAAMAGGAASGAARPVTLTEDEARRIGVTYAVAQRGPLGRDVRTVGQVTFDETRVRTIAPKLDGWVEQLVVNATGQYVVPGQALLTLYSPMLISAQEELLLARRLVSDVAGASDDARQRANDLLRSARQRLAYWDIPDSVIADIERAGTVRRTMTMRASSGGYVLEKSVLAGQKIMSGDALFKLADLGTVWIEGEVFEQDLPSVQAGAVVRSEFQALPGDARTGRIAYIYPTLDPNTRTVRVRVVMPNPGLRLKPGMYATLLIAGAQRQSVLTVPRSAVLSTGERSMVFVRDANGQLAPREVALGVSTDERIEILRGLEAGETVVASATFLVDAESNLGKALGGMGNMPGMDMTAPPKPLPKGKE